MIILKRNPGFVSYLNWEVSDNLFSISRLTIILKMPTTVRYETLVSLRCVQAPESQNYALKRCYFSNMQFSVNVTVFQPVAEDC